MQRLRDTLQELDLTCSLSTPRSSQCRVWGAVDGLPALRKLSLDVIRDPGPDMEFVRLRGLRELRCKDGVGVQAVQSLLTLNQDTLEVVHCHGLAQCASALPSLVKCTGVREVLLPADPQLPLLQQLPALSALTVLCSQRGHTANLQVGEARLRVLAVPIQWTS